MKVSSQKHTIEEKQKEILDSIYYVSTMQQPLLLTEKFIKQKFKTATRINLAGSGRATVLLLTLFFAV